MTMFKVSQEMIIKEKKKQQLKDLEEEQEVNRKKSRFVKFILNFYKPRKKLEKN